MLISARLILIFCVTCLTNSNFFNPAQAQVRVAPTTSAEKQAKDFIDRGWKYRRSGDVKNELVMFERSVAPARQSKNPRLLADSLRFVGYTYGVLKRKDDALRCQQEAIAIFQRLREIPLEVLTRRDMGWTYQFAGDPKSALPIFEEVLRSYQQLKYTKEVIETYNGLGASNYDLGNWEQAIQANESGLKLSRSINDKEAEANALYYILLSSRKAKRFDDAKLVLKELYTASADIRDVTLLLRIADEAWNIGRHKDAVGLFTNALDIAEKQKDKRNVLLAYNGLCRSYMSAGMNKSGIAATEKAIIISESLNDKSNVAWCRARLGEFYINTGEHKKAEPLLKEAIRYFTSTATANADGAFWANLSLSTLYTAQGRFAEALDAITKAQFQKVSSAVTRTSLFAGRAYLVFGMPQAAIPYFDRYASWCEKGYGSTHVLSQVLNLWGKAYISINEPNLALPLLTKSVDLARTMQDQQAEGNALATLASAYAALSDFERGKEAFESSLALFRATASKIGEASALNGLGELELRRGNADAAQEWINQSIRLYQNIGDSSSAAKARANLGNVYEMKGDLSAALVQYYIAVDLQEKVRGTFGAMTEAKTTFLATNAEPYRRRMRVLLRQNRTPDMFDTAQSLKARALLDLMSSQGTNSAATEIAGKMTAEERKTEVSLRDACAQFNRRMIAEAVTNEEGSKARYDENKIALTKADQKLTSFLNGLYARYPTLATQRGARTTTLADAAKALPTDTALLEFLTLRVGLNPAHRTDETLVFVVTKDAAGKTKVALHRIAVPQAELSERINDLRAACASPDRPYQLKAKEMYATLLAPAEKDIAGKKRLIICPDGMLWDVPFAALTDSTGKTLWSRFEIACAYSATTAVSALNRKPSLTPLKERNLLVVANPDFGDAVRFGGDATELPTGKGNSRPISVPDRPISVPDRLIGTATSVRGLIRGGRIVALPGTQREADSIRKGFGARANLLTGAGAQETVFKQDALAYPYVHIATHGFFNDVAPLESALILAAPSTGSGDDGFLTAREIFSLDLSKSELVVLSACNTARGEQRSGEGVIGLTWALFAAGCPSQIVSQWPVNDASTATIMTGFYDRLAQGKGKAAALRESALALSQTEKTAHPYYWSPFVLLGDWR